MRRLDKSKPFGSIFGSVPNGACYTQDGLYFNSEGRCLGDGIEKVDPAYAEEEVVQSEEAKAFEAKVERVLAMGAEKVFDAATNLIERLKGEGVEVSFEPSIETDDASVRSNAEFIAKHIS